VIHRLALRHDHGSVYLSRDFQQEVSFLGMTSSPAFVRQPEGNGCIECFRTLKEQLLWVQHFSTIEELRQALLAFKETYNREWLIARLGYRSPAPAASGICAHAGGVITLTVLSNSRGGRRTPGVEMEAAVRYDSLRHGTGRALLRAPDEHDGRDDREFDEGHGEGVNMSMALIDALVDLRCGRERDDFRPGGVRRW